MKKRTFIIITVLLILVAVAAILWQTGVFAKKNKTTGSNNLSSNSGSNSSGKTTTALSSNTTATDKFPLKLGSKGNNVKLLQRVLNAGIKYDFDGKITTDKGKTYTSLVVDGIFGTNTYNVAEYILDTDLDRDGVSQAYLAKLQVYFNVF